MSTVMLPTPQKVAKLRELAKVGELRSANPAVDDLIEKLQGGTEIVCGSFRQVSEHSQSGGSDSFSQFDENNA